MDRRRSVLEDSSPSIRSKIAREAAQATIEEFVTGPHFRQVVEEAVNAALNKLGIDTDNAEEVRAFRTDLTYLRNWRSLAEAVKKQGLITTVSIVTSALLTALFIGVGVMIYRHTAGG